MTNLKSIPEQHCKGSILITDDYKEFDFDPLNADIGISISDDGRMWICINGVSFLRFKPSLKMENK